MNNRQLFLQHVAQTSPAPIGLEIIKAEGIYQYDIQGKSYIDLISGFSVCNIGHSHPDVIKAVQEQAANYMHLIVYGEFVEAPQVQYAQMLAQHLPASLQCIYFTNSGSEAVEGAMKLAKRYTNRSKIIAFNNSYHGSTQGSLSIIGSEYFRNAYRPLLPGIIHATYNDDAILEQITEETACILMEVVQAEAGVLWGNKTWLQKIREKCTQTGTLLIFDEIQSGFGRTGSLWAFEQAEVVPDILLLGKALGGGMPLGAFISSKEIMQALTYNPVLGHISTFAGHPVSCAAGLAAFNVLMQENWINTVKEKEAILQTHLQHPAIQKLTTAGLWACIYFDSFDTNKKIIDQCIAQGLITDWFLFRANGLRIAPPLSIDNEILVKVCQQIITIINHTL